VEKPWKRKRIIQVSIFKLGNAGEAACKACGVSHQCNRKTEGGNLVNRGGSRDRI